MVSPLVTAAVAGAAVGMLVYHTINSRIALATEEVMAESGGLQTMAERLLQLEGRGSFEGPGFRSALLYNIYRAGQFADLQYPGLKSVQKLA